MASGGSQELDNPGRDGLIMIPGGHTSRVLTTDWQTGNCQLAGLQNCRTADWNYYRTAELKEQWPAKLRFAAW